MRTLRLTRIPPPPASTETDRHRGSALSSATACATPTGASALGRSLPSFSSTVNFGERFELGRSRTLRETPDPAEGVLQIALRDEQGREQLAVESRLGPLEAPGIVLVPEPERRLARRVHQLRARYPLATIDVVAHSAGCGVALGGLARLEAPQVRTVVLIAPSVSPKKKYAQPAVAPLGYRELM